MTRSVRTYIKPLSMNRAYKGRKVKTRDYNKYRKDLMSILPRLRVPKSGPLWLKMTVYYSRRSSDIDNCLKPFIDILQERYNFNDNRIYRLHIDKKLVKRGKDGIEFKIIKYTGKTNE